MPSSMQANVHEPTDFTPEPEQRPDIVQPNDRHPLHGLSATQRVEERVHELSGVLAGILRRLDEKGDA